MNHRIEQLNRDRKALVRMAQNMAEVFKETGNGQAVRDVNTLTRSIWKIDQELMEVSDASN